MGDLSLFHCGWKFEFYTVFDIHLVAKGFLYQRLLTFVSCLTFVTVPIFGHCSECLLSDRSTEYNRCAHVVKWPFVKKLMLEGYFFRLIAIAYVNKITCTLCSAICKMSKHTSTKKI